MKSHMAEPLNSSFRIDAHTDAALSASARWRGVSRSQLVRDAVRLYFHEQAVFLLRSRDPAALNDLEPGEDPAEVLADLERRHDDLLASMFERGRAPSLRGAGAL